MEFLKGCILPNSLPIHDPMHVRLSHQLVPKPILAQYERNIAATKDTYQVSKARGPGSEAHRTSRGGEELPVRRGVCYRCLMILRVRCLQVLGLHSQQGIHVIVVRERLQIGLVAGAQPREVASETESIFLGRWVCVPHLCYRSESARWRPC